MGQNVFKFYYSYFEQTNKTTMGSHGNPLSPFLVEIFMSSFKTELKNNRIFQKSGLDMQVIFILPSQIKISI